MKRLGFLFCATVLTACANTASVEPEIKDAEPNPVFEKGLRSLERQEYAEAAKIFDQLLVSDPGAKWDLVITYNSAAAHEGLGNCEKAAERYREVVRASNQKFQRMEAQALFRLSLMYECLGQDTKAVAALLETEKRAQALPPETVQAEVPARLAAAYSRLGNREKALDYFDKAGLGLKAIIARSTGSTRPQTELLARTLFLMGQLNPQQRKAEAAPEAYLLSISMQQPHLLQAVEMNHPLYSQKAFDELHLAYANIWKYKFEDLNKRRSFYEKGLQVAGELRRLRLPDANSMVDAVYSDLSKTEARLKAELSKLAETTRLTREAEQRDGLRQTGRLVDPPRAKAKRKR